MRPPTTRAAEHEWRHPLSRTDHDSRERTTTSIDHPSLLVDPGPQTRDRSHRLNAVSTLQSGLTALRAELLGP